jgi:malonate-semialdehyde dehydrogenase (acetylating)/methylmalonate-semialdehyde dehydrogenase
MWMYPFAIAAGNTFILKPSELVPLTASFAVDLLHEAGLPPGVMNLVHGNSSTVDALLHHQLVKAISFVGSTPVAKYVYSTAAVEGKRVQAMGGAKNHLVVMPDANMAKTADSIMTSAFGGAGQRCLAGSVLLAVGSSADPLLELLVERARKLKVGDGSRPGIDMGPLISAEHAGRVAGYVQRGIAEGAVALCDGRAMYNERRNERGGYFMGPTIFDQARPEMSIATDEIFGPVLAVIRVATLDEAIAIVNRSRFGNASSIFTESGSAAREYESRVEAGMVGINIGVAAPMAFFPFAGWKQSFFGDLHAHGKDAIAFYTEQKVVTSRWFS